MVKVGLDTKGFRSGASDVRQGTADLKNKISDLSKTMTEQQLRLKQLGQSGKGASNEYRQLKAEIAGNRQVFSAFQRELRATSGEIGRTSNMAGQLKGVMSSFTGGLIGGGVGAAVTMGAAKVGQTFTETLQVAVSFDDAMRKVAATSGATSKEFEKLRQSAIAMGSATRFTASESAEALNYMALAGWNADQAIAGLPGVLALAAASATDLASTSDILTDTMAAFGMAANQSTEAADIFAQIQSKTNTTVLLLGEAMKYAAPQAAAAGQSLKTTATILGLLANQGIKGTMSGTALNAMLKDLKNKANDGVLAFGNMNIKLYDAQGNFRNLLDIIKEMRTGVAGLTTQQRDAITGGLFEERSIKAVNILLNTTEQTLNDLAVAMDNTGGRSKAMSEIMEGGVGGALRRMKSAWEGLQLTVSQDSGLAESWYNTWAQQFLLWTAGAKDIINWWQELTGTIKRDMTELRKVFNEKFQIVPKINYLAPNAPGLPKQSSDPELNMPGAPVENALTKPIKTATAAYEEFQKELQTTREWLTFIGKENEYVGKAAEMTARKMEEVFKMGGNSAVKYAQTLQTELAKLTMTATPQSQGVPTLHPQIIQKIELPKDFQIQVEAAIGVTARLKEELRIARAEARAFGDEYDLIGAEIQAVSAAIGEAIKAGLDIDTTQLQELIEQLDKLKQKKDEIQNASAKEREESELVKQTLGGLSSAFETTFATLASGNEAGAAAMKTFGASALQAGVQAAKGALIAATGEQLKSNSKFGAVGIALAGAAIAALFGMFSGALSRTSGIKLAKGGLAFGETLATIGDNPGAKFDPEVISPLSKLKAMMGENTTNVTGTFRVAGDDLILVLDNAKRKSKAFRV